MATKICSRCGIEQDVAMFHKCKRSSDGLTSRCKKCNVEYCKEYRLNNKEKLYEYHKEYYLNNKEKLVEHRKEYRLNNKEKIAKHNKKYRLNNKEKLAEYYLNNKEKRTEYQKEYRKERCKTDSLFKFKNTIRNSIRLSFARCGYSKSTKTEEIVGCSIEFLIEHLKQTYFDRYGEEYIDQEVHIDHIIPLKTANSESEVIALCHYSNLQLLTPKDNLEKGAKLLEVCG